MAPPVEPSITIHELGHVAQALPLAERHFPLTEAPSTSAERLLYAF